MGRTQSRAKEIEQWCEEYSEEFGIKVVDLDEVAQWAIDTGRWTEKPSTPKQRCRREIASVLRRAHYTDPQQRQVRTWHAALVEEPDGQMRWEWGDIRKVEPSHMRVSQQYGRRQILDHCRQHQTVTESYNDNNPFGAQLEPTDYNFNLDLEEERYSTDYPEDPDE